MIYADRPERCQAQHEIEPLLVRSHQCLLDRDHDGNHEITVHYYWKDKDKPMNDTGFGSPTHREQQAFHHTGVEAQSKCAHLNIDSKPPVTCMLPIGHEGGHCAATGERWGHPHDAPTSPQSVYLRIPTVDTVVRPLTKWLHHVPRDTDQYTFDADILYTAGWGIAEGRNNIIRLFLDSDCDILWMIDSDVVPPVHTGLLDRLDAERQMVSGVYEGFKLELGLYWHVYDQTGTDDEGYPTYAIKPTPTWPPEPFHAAAAGLGCIVMTRRFVEALPEDPFQFTRKKDGTLQGEDFLFFHAHNGVWVDPTYPCAHAKQVDLSAIHQAMAQRILR